MEGAEPESLPSDEELMQRLAKDLRAKSSPKTILKRLEDFNLALQVDLTKQTADGQVDMSVQEDRARLFLQAGGLRTVIRLLRYILALLVGKLGSPGLLYWCSLHI
jgi:hypothetical protein